MKVNEQLLVFLGVWLAGNESSSTKKIAQERLIFACLCFYLAGTGESFKITNLYQDEC